MIQFYRMYDPEPKGVIPITPTEAFYWNEKKWGIFWALQTFKNGRRIDDLEKVRVWAIDIDFDSPSLVLEALKKGLPPSGVVRTKRGYHVYWKAIDAKAENYAKIMTDYLVPFYNADQNAKDLARILRVPGFKHWKDPNNPFTVKMVYSQDVSYLEEDIVFFYGSTKDKKQQQKIKHEVKKSIVPYLNKGEDGLFERIWSLDCEEALYRLSGHAAVGGETFSFRRVSNGNLNILVNGKGTSTWIDKDKRLGSLDRGGPTVYQWVNWYQQNPKRTLNYLKEVFPELWK